MRKIVLRVQRTGLGLFVSSALAPVAWLLVVAITSPSCEQNDQRHAPFDAPAHSGDAAGDTTAGDTTAGDTTVGDTATDVPTAIPGEESLRNCEALFTGESTCCLFDPEPAEWQFLPEPCPNADPCSETVECPPGYVQRGGVYPIETCLCIDLTTYERTDCKSGDCEPGSYRLSSVRGWCHCEPLGVGSCAPEPDRTPTMWDSDRYCPAGYYHFTCPQSFFAGRPVQYFCADCPCPSVDHSLEIHEQWDPAVVSWSRCIRDGGRCEYNPQEEDWYKAPAFLSIERECGDGNPCPPGYQPKFVSDGECRCAPQGPQSCEAVAVIPRDDDCPPPRGDSTMYKCPIDDENSFCTTCACPMVDITLPL